MFRKSLAVADRTVAALERALLVVSVAALVAILLLVLFAIFARSFPSIRVPDNVIIVEDLMVVAIACGLGYVTSTRAHIGIDIFYNLLGRPAQQACDVLGSVVGLIAFGPLAIWVYLDVVSLYAGGSFYYGELRLPEWPAKLMFLLGLMALSLRLVLLLLADLMDDGARGDGASSARLDPV